MKKAAKIIGIIAGVLLIIVVIAVLSNGSNNTNSLSTNNGSPAQDDSQMGNDDVSEPETFLPITLTGSSDKTTAPFEVTTDEWIIDWSYIPDSEYLEYAVFGFFIYPRGETAMYIEAVSASDDTSGSTYSYAGAGEYYVEVICANLQSWEITIRPA